MTVAAAAPAWAASTAQGTFDTSGITLLVENDYLRFSGTLGLTAPAAATNVTATIGWTGSEQLYAFGAPSGWAPLQPATDPATGNPVEHTELQFVRTASAGATTLPFLSATDNGPDVIVGADLSGPPSGRYEVTFWAPGYATSTPLLSTFVGGI